MDQDLPSSRPQCVLSDAEWAFIRQRDNNSCARVELCRKEGRCSPTGFCSQKVEVDHRQPQKWRGDSSFANLRLFCDVPNRSRPNVPLKKWQDANFWDKELNADKLRRIQRYAAYLEIVALASAIASYDEKQQISFRNALLEHITFIPGTTGIGKCLVLQAAFCALNSIIKSPYPRVCNVLWFSPERALRDSTEKEIKEEGLKYGIFRESPNVTRAKKFDDLRGSSNNQYAVTVVCPQTLWERKNSIRTEHEKRLVLARYDTIVFDEVDWADTQMQLIASLCTHALKFAISAIPPSEVLAIMEGKAPVI